MSGFTVAAIAALALAGALGCAVLAVRGRRPTIAAVRNTLYAPPVVARPGLPASTRPSATESGAAAPPSSVVRPLVRVLGAGPLGDRVRRSFGSGLALVGLGPDDVVSRLVVGALAAAGAVVLSTGGLIALGSLPASPWWIALALGAGGAGATVMWSDARTKVDRARHDLDRAVNDFVQLVAVGLTTDQSVDEAVTFALGVVEGPMVALLRDEVRSAPLRGVAVWEALDALGRRLDHPVLCELAGSVERQGTHGVSITRTVASIASAQRARSLDELEREADRANANLAGPTVCFVVTTVVFLAYPLATRISEAFGG